MPVLTPVRDLDVLDHVTRIPSGEGRHSGWTVRIETDGRTYERHFSDKGNAPAALQQAVDWRDDKVNRINRQQGRLDREGKGRELGVWITTRGNSDLVIGSLPATDDEKRQRIVRTVEKHTLEGAIRQACEFRFRGMRDRLGDDYPFKTVEDLIRAVTEAVVV